MLHILQGKYLRSLIMQHSSSTEMFIWSLMRMGQDDMVKNRTTLQSLVTILRGKNFTGALTFEEGKVLFSEGTIKYASYNNESGELVLNMLSPLPLPLGTQVVQLSKNQVKLWLKWEELLHEEEELYISPLPDVDRKTLERLLEENELTYLLVQTSKGE